MRRVEHLALARAARVVHLHHVARILGHHRSVALLDHLVEQTRLGLLHARLLLDLREPLLRSLGVLHRHRHHEVVLQILAHLLLGHLGRIVEHVLNRLADPNHLERQSGVGDREADVVAQRIGEAVALLLGGEHGRIGRRILHLGRIAARTAHAVGLGTLLGYGLRTLAALGHEVGAQRLQRVVVRERGLAQRGLLDPLANQLGVERNVLHLITEAVPDIGAQRIRQRVEFRQTAHFQRLVAAAGAEQHGTRERRNR